MSNKETDILEFIIMNSETILKNLYPFIRNHYETDEDLYDHVMYLIRKQAMYVFNLTYEDVCCILDKKLIFKAPFNNLFFVKENFKNETNSLH
jgi:hypothetical protein